MRLDVLTIAVVVFVVGLFFSSFGISDVVDSGAEAPAPHQQGFKQ